MTLDHARVLTLTEKAARLQLLMEHPGWSLLQQTFKPEIRTKVNDSDTKEAFMYEAIRAQVIQEIMTWPTLIVNQAERILQGSRNTNAFSLPATSILKTFHPVQPLEE
jgi:hypothetical protein